MGLELGYFILYLVIERFMGEVRFLGYRVIVFYICKIKCYLKYIFNVFCGNI